MGGRGEDDQPVSLGRLCLDQGDQGLQDAVGEAQADGIPFNYPLNVV